MVLSIIFLEDKHKILLHLSIFYEYQQFFQHRICFSIQPPDYSDPLPRLAHPSSFFLIRLFNKYVKFLNWIVFSWSCKVYNISFSDLNLWLWIHKVCLLQRNRYDVEKTVDTHKILINAIKFYVCLQEI
jgi:hypothetical protein